MDAPDRLVTAEVVCAGEGHNIVEASLSASASELRSQRAWFV
jgi:hypothetical protein